MKEKVNQNYKRDFARVELRECFLECEIMSGQGAGFKGRLDKRAIRRLRKDGGEVIVFDEEEEKKLQAKEGSKWADAKDK